MALATLMEVARQDGTSSTNRKKDQGTSGSNEESHGRLH